ncbi:Ovarian tumour, otubain domain-containing protein [Strongyloides ratti]|uniref:ubiquitinyl hydrolase 1 n=1 Tax=Strongyloides ratti TaxID=34506 RepID=A0A090LHK0_STRRB|nr:Ovarian tumour, otubain domain-containing protein [Strongyloides ratti]CEF67633.1 Ovarian tumour, otubain domain-containing protein [Strongyloides ratti]
MMKHQEKINEKEENIRDEDKPSTSGRVINHRQTPSTTPSISKTSVSNSSYAFILPNLDSFIPEFKLFLEKEMIELSVLRRLESSGHLNWWCTMDSTKSQKLFPLLTTGDGNCLMHAISLGIWGVHDSQLALRNAVWNLLTNSKKKDNLKRRWRWSEEKNNKQSGLIFSEEEWGKEWNEILEIASCKTKRSKEESKEKVSESTESIDKDSVSSTNTIPPLSDDIIYESLETIHVYALANVLRRPIIVVADTILRNAAGEELSPINFGGIYLPLEWPASMCHRSPLVLCYDSSHFSPLVAMKQPTSFNTCLQAIPITDKNRNLLPVHFSVDPGSNYNWSNNPTDIDIRNKIENEQTIENQISLIGEYMDIVRMDLKKGSKKKSVPIKTGNVTVPEKLLTLAAGSTHSNYELKSSHTKDNSPSIEQSKNSRIFKEIVHHFIKFKNFSMIKHKKSKSLNDFERKSLKVKASELRQSNCVLTVLLHNYVHQHTDYMVKMYIRNAKERFDAYRKSLYNNFTENGPPPKAHTLPRSRISRSFSFANATVSCINADCQKNATPALYFLCNDCFDRQKKEMMEDNCELEGENTLLQKFDKKNLSYKCNGVMTGTENESISEDEKFDNEIEYITSPTQHCISGHSLISQTYLHKHLKNCHEEGNQGHSHGGWSATKISPTSYTGVGSY